MDLTSNPSIFHRSSRSVWVRRGISSGLFRRAAVQSLLCSQCSSGGAENILFLPLMAETSHLKRGDHYFHFILQQQLNSSSSHPKTDGGGGGGGVGGGLLPRSLGNVRRRCRTSEEGKERKRRKKKSKRCLM